MDKVPPRVECARGGVCGGLAFLASGERNAGVGGCGAGDGAGEGEVGYGRDAAEVGGGRGRREDVGVCVGAGCVYHGGGGGV